jgi:P-type E1-E2 ATPase
MVGDGINDALALSQADMSLSFANASQVAKVSSDAIITSDRIQVVEKTLNIAKYTYNIIIQNYFLALVYNIVMIPIAAGLITFFGYKFTPEMAAIAMSISSISVVVNSQRIRK